MRTPTDHVCEFVYEKYVSPALERGDNRVKIQTSQVCKALHDTHSHDLVGAVLSSIQFRNTYHLALECAELATTETYTFRLNAVGTAILADSDHPQASR
jgi:hypothetical protein